MKSRAVMLVFTACLVSSLAFADNPADAPLMSNSAGTPVEHQESCKDPTSGQRHDKKDKALPLKPKHESGHPSPNHREGYRGNPEYPAIMKN
jgi:hypothetical protein